MANYIELDFLSVETKKSGDAIGVRYELDGSTYIHVVDGGYLETGERLREHVNTHYGSPAYIDNVVATHNDGDHARGLRSILEHFNVGALWMLRPWTYAAELLPRFPTYTSQTALASTLRRAYANLADLEDVAVTRGIPIFEPFQGAQIGAFTVMAPTRSRYLDLVVTSNKTPEGTSSGTTGGLLGLFVEAAKTVAGYVRAAWGEEIFPPGDTSNENEMSVVQYTIIDGEKILLTADTGRDGLREVINYAPTVGLLLPGIGHFQVPHHGGRHNVNSELLDAIVGPRLSSKPAAGHFQAFISSAKEDEDHPRKVVVAAMIHRGANVYPTEGITIHWGSRNAPARGWKKATPATYPDEIEE